jgi:mRNA interferase RelE/StbE
MRYEIYLAPEAVDDLDRLPAHVRAAVKSAIETHLRHTPTATSKSSIKRLRRENRPQYRLRVGDVRVFYDVYEVSVEVVAVVPKSGAADWLERRGE